MKTLRLTVTFPDGSVSKHEFHYVVLELLAPQLLTLWRGFVIRPVKIVTEFL